AGDLKQSSIYLNQLMAFATISNTILAAVLQTQTAKDIKSDAANFFFNAAVHTAEVVAAGLISSLSLMKDSRVALIAGMNCFLPTVAADFGKYLVCYRLQRDDASGLQGLRCPFLPGSAGLTSATQVVGGLILFMVAALWTWLSLSRSDEDPKPSHVVFLTSKYQRRYALFETERLIRKTLFTFIGALLPIHSSPALQMGCLGIVVLVSLFLYCRYKPYHSPEWNWIEIWLLFAAAVMITSVSTLPHCGGGKLLGEAAKVEAPPFFAISKGATRAAATALALSQRAHGLCITGCAFRPSREEVQQPLETEVTHRDARPIAEASRSRNLDPGMKKAAPVEAEYPHCDGLPDTGSHVIHTARIVNTSCTWHGNPGLQVTLKETLTFQGNLVLKGEIQIMGEQELDGINVSGKMTVIAANASFVGCRNRMQDGKGGALFIQRDFIVSNSGVKFENCRASE
ncbi:unnamed protein product, partial [Symbiodinium sp. KB8]